MFCLFVALYVLETLQTVMLLFSSQLDPKLQNIGKYFNTNILT